MSVNRLGCNLTKKINAIVITKPFLTQHMNVFGCQEVSSVEEMIARSVELETLTITMRYT